MTIVHKILKPVLLKLRETINMITKDAKSYSNELLVLVSIVVSARHIVLRLIMNIYA